MRQSTPEVGDIAPDFDAKTSENENFKLSNALATGRNIMLVFYRGHW